MYKLEYRIKGVGVVSRKFHTIKSMSQYIRRQKIKRFKRYTPEGEIFCMIGSTLITLKASEMMVQELQKAL